jgi:transcriptional regulator with XRE-family HTH domain
MNVLLLQRLMAERGFDIASLADACGVEKLTMKIYLRGARPGRSVLKLMAATLGCKVEDLDMLAEHRAG